MSVLAMLSARSLATAARIVPSTAASLIPSASIRLGSPTKEQKEQFAQDGFILMPSVIDRAACDAIAHRLDECFAGRFETLIYPDEWYWRAELSRHDVTRHMCNVWKSDRLVASVLLSENLGRFAGMLMGFNGARMGSDSVWVKPPNGQETSVSFHTDSMYVPFPMITGWLTLTDATKQNGALEYAVGSHKWQQKEAFARDGLHGSHYGYRSEVVRAAHQVGLKETDIKFSTMECPAGSIVFHHGDLWHGSDTNTTKEFRRTIAVHLIEADSKFKGDEGYIYGRYRKFNQDNLDEAFFPITWHRNGSRSQAIDHHLCINT